MDLVTIRHGNSRGHGNVVHRENDLVGLGYCYCPHSPVVHLCSESRQAGIRSDVAHVVGSSLAQSSALAKVVTNKSWESVRYPYARNTKIGYG